MALEREDQKEELEAFLNGKKPLPAEEQGWYEQSPLIHVALQ